MDNYFALLSLPESYALSQSALEAAYFAAQRATHPDRFVGRPESERTAAILKSQGVNDAYEALKNPLTRAEHLLALHDIVVAPENNKPPTMLLMEMMELREQIAQAAAIGALELARVIEDVKRATRDCEQRLAELCNGQRWLDAAPETLRLSYLFKALEEAYTHTYRLKAGKI